MSCAKELKAYEEANKEFTTDFRSWGNEDLLGHTTKTLKKIQDITESLLSNTEYVNKLHVSSRRATQELERRAHKRTEAALAKVEEEAKVEASKSLKRAAPEKPVSPKETGGLGASVKKSKTQETQALVNKKFDKPEKSAPNGGVGKCPAVDKAIAAASVRAEQQRRLDWAATQAKEGASGSKKKVEEIEGNSKKPTEKAVEATPATAIVESEDDIPLATLAKVVPSEPLPVITATETSSTEESIRKKQEVEHEKALRKQALQLRYELMEAKLKELDEQLKSDSQPFSALE